MCSTIPAYSPRRKPLASEPGDENNGGVGARFESGGGGEGAGGAAGDFGARGGRIGRGFTFNVGPQGLPVGGPIYDYSRHAFGRIVLDTRGDGGVSNAAIEETLNYGRIIPERDGTIAYFLEDLARIIINPETGKVVTAMPRGRLGERYPHLQHS